MNKSAMKKIVSGIFLCLIVLTVGGSGLAHHAEPGTGSEDATVTLETEPARIQAGIPATLLFSIADRQGKPVEDLSVHHERLLHIIIASQDFRVFAHIHPEDFGPITAEMTKTARYPVRFVFPKAGRYIIGIDFAVKEQLYSRHFTIDVTGEPAMELPKKDFSREERIGEMDVTFSSSSEHITAGKEVTLTYVFRLKGRPVTDLEPYLSAPMHLAIISDDLNHFIHTHGELPGMSGTDHGRHQMHMSVPGKFGPRIAVRVVFPSKGLYHIFGQVSREGKVILTSFMVKVE